MNKYKFFNSNIEIYKREKYPSLVLGLLASRWALGEYVLVTRALRFRS